MAPSFHLSFRPNILLVSTVRRFELDAAADADAYYQQMMLKTAKRTDGSGLGLSRIRAEAEMSLHYELVDDRVCIQATSAIAGGRNP